VSVVVVGLAVENPPKSSKLSVVDGVIVLLNPPKSPKPVSSVFMPVVDAESFDENSPKPEFSDFAAVVDELREPKLKSEVLGDTTVEDGFVLENPPKS